MVAPARVPRIGVGLLVVVLGGVARAGEPPVSARQTAHQLIGLLGRHDLDGARKLTVGFPAFAALSRQRFDRELYEKKLAGFLEGLSRDLAAGLRLRDAVTADVLILPPDEKLRREVVMAVVVLTFLGPDGRPLEGPPLPLTFIGLEGRWKLLLRD